MPTEQPLIRRVKQEEGHSVALFLETDAIHFWSIIRRHAMKDDNSPFAYTPWLGTSITYRTYPDIQDDIPNVLSKGIFLWQEGQYADGKPYNAHAGYWSGVRVAWEPVSLLRLRVVITSGDLPENLLVAYDVLSAIHTAYPESRSQLQDIVGMVESWAYDDKTVAWWRETVVRWGIEVTATHQLTTIPHMLPEMPPPIGHEGYDWDDVFDWWYRGGRLYFSKLKEMARVLGVVEKTIYNRHSPYKAQYGESPKPDGESKYSASSGSDGKLSGSE